MKKFLIIDGNNIAYRAFYALPFLKTLSGEPTSVLYGFTNILIKTIKDVCPDYIAIAFDKGKQTFRHKMYSDYKAQRAPTPDDLVRQMPKLKQLLTAMKIQILEDENIEADDIIGILTRSFDTENVILSSDKDVFQLINNNTYVMSPKNGVSETAIVNQEKLQEMYGLLPKQIIDLKALMGDSSDNIPGVKGVGEKTALRLLSKYQTLDNVYANLVDIKGKLQEKLLADKENAYLSKELATINLSYDKKFDLQDFALHFPFGKEVQQLFLNYQFNALLKRTDLFSDDIVPDVEEVSINVKNLNTKQEINTLAYKCLTAPEIAVYLNESAMHVYTNEAEHVISFEADLLSATNDFDSTLHAFKPVFESAKVKKVVFDAKKFKHILSSYDILLNGVHFDVLLARYLIYSGMRGEASFENVLKENAYSKNNFAFYLMQLKNNFTKLLKEHDLERLYYEIELPLVEVLFNMEKQGFKIDVHELQILKEKYEATLENLTKNIHQLAGEEFNVNSPKQLSEILFKKLGLHAYNNKKLSTNVNVLTEISNQHQIVPLVLEYRQISKLYSTYVSAFDKLVDRQTGKIHTVFHQALTATGRLSSSEPNLQNIPIKTKEGRNIRKIFISNFENGKIISADYNQIELRLLADFSNDLNMISAYNNNEDIHKKTASEIFNIPMAEITPELRNNAKAINFGIIYGISDYGLSQNIGGTRKDASEFMKLYFEKYPNVDKYMKSNIEFCKKHGYVKTYFGRIRNIPEITSSNKNLQSFGERAAMNMPLQGTASDIIKLAMIKVYNALERNKLKSKLILQVHDELIIDTHASEVEMVKAILKEEMENVVRLKVGLITSISVGNSWYEA